MRTVFIKSEDFCVSNPRDYISECLVWGLEIYVYFQTLNDFEETHFCDKAN